MKPCQKIYVCLMLCLWLAVMSNTVLTYLRPEPEGFRFGTDHGGNNLIYEVDLKEEHDR